MLESLGRPPRLPQDIRLLSLDVFDTALRRDCAQPEHIFRRVEERLAAQGTAVAGFAELRRRAEALARETAFAAHGCPEVTLEAIYAHLASLSGLPAALAETAKALEITAEQQAVSAERPILDLYDQAVRAGIPVVFVSDMYLPRPVIAALLAACGYQGEPTLFVSAERMRTKGDGGLFADLLATFELAGNRVLHIGDHPHADGAAPAALGIRHLPYAHTRRAMAKDRPPAAPGLALSARKAAHWPTQPTLPAGPALLDFLGRTYGPAIHGGYVRWITEQVREMRPDAVLFFSRDGYFPKRLYDAARQRQPDLPPAAYCCVSRSVLNLARITDCDEGAVAFLLSGTMPRNAGQILARCGLPLAGDRGMALLAEHGLTPQTVVTNDAGNRAAMADLLAGLAVPLRERAAAMRAALTGYLARFGCAAMDRVAVVDLGWSGNSFRAFAATLADLGFGGELTGLFLGLLAPAPGVRDGGPWPVPFLTNILADLGEAVGDGPDPASALGPVALLEVLHAAPHGGVGGYEYRHGAFRPVFADNPPERAQYERSVAVYQAACLDALSAMDPDDAALSREACREALIDLCLHPTKEEASVLGELEHYDGIEHTGDGAALAPGLPPDADAGDIRQELARAYWKSGFLARNSAACRRAGLLPDAAPAAGRHAPAPPPRPQKTILVLTHELSRTGAPIVLLNWLAWLRRHTDFALRIIRLWNHGDLLPEFAALGPVCSYYDDIAAPGLSRSQHEAALADFCGAPVSFVFGNTAFCAEMYDLAASLGAPIVTNVHELESVLCQGVGAERLGAMYRHTDRYVAGSPSVAQNLIANHPIPAARVDMVHESIIPTVRAADLAAKDALRRRLDIPGEAVVVLGCGTIEARKGVDIFIEVAARVRRRLGRQVLFYWVGAPSAGHPLDTDALVAAHGVAGGVVFTGQTPTPKDYFLAGDLFLLPSREDCVSLVGLEACECGLPVVCFEGAGDLPAFVRPEAGEAVAYGDAAAMADSVAGLAADAPRRKALGRAARKKLLASHVTDRAAPFLLESCLSALRRWPGRAG